MIRQKNGELKAIDKNRIINAVKKANNKYQELKETDINDIADYIDYKCGGDKEFELDEVNDLIENQIMIRGAYNTARTYDRNRMNKNRDTDIQSIDRKANKETIKNLQIRKKNGTLEPYSVSKLLSAVSKSAVRARDNENITDEESTIFITLVENDLAKMVKAENTNIVPTGHVHMLVEKHLDYVAPDIGKAYSNYRSFRLGQAKIWENIRGKCTVLISNDKDTDTMTQKNQNANADSQLTSTQKCFFADYTGEGYYEDQFLTKEERQIAEDGYLYWHDKNARILAPLNCCLWRMDYVLKHGFQMNGVWYNQPKSLDTAFDVIGDLTLMAASQQYGGFTIPRIDSLLVPYAEKTYQANIDRYMAKGIIKETAEEMAYEDVVDNMRHGFQGLEYKFNTVASSRGDYPFTTVTFGLDTTKFGKLAAKICLETRMNGEGEKGKKKPVLFPKLVFLYDKNLHGKGCINEDVYEAGIACSSKTMYPDWLSLTGEGYVPSMYKKYGVDGVISPMGCVLGSEKVAFILDGNSYFTSIENLFHLAKKSKGHKTKTGKQGTEIWLKEGIAKIWDNKIGDFTPLYRVIQRNPEYNKWVKVCIGSFYKGITVTEDHPFETENRGIVLAKDLSLNDQIIVSKNFSYHYFEKKSKNEDDVSYFDFIDNYGEDKDLKTETEIKFVYSIERDEDIEAYSYDVTTESEHFAVSGVYSHNCRAFLSPYYERGGFDPADENDKVVFEGRFNLGVISLNLPMIFAKAQKEDKDFYETLDYYLNVIRNNHKRTYEYLGSMKASKNPVGFCYGGFYGGNLKMDENIAPVLKSSTMSFGVTALNELQMLYNGKSLREDGQFALEVMKYINDKITEFKKEDHILYAIYGTPAENLCNKQVRQFRAKYGIVKGVSDREYVSNSFHCHVTEDITPIEKQNLEKRFWDYFNGGKIQYCRYPVDYNIEAMKSLILRAMEMGFYEGVNMSLCFCDDCGYQELEIGNKCPKCGGYHITQIDRMNGYLSFTRVGSDTIVKEDENGNKIIEIHSRYSPHKIKEISERVSM